MLMIMMMISDNNKNIVFVNSILFRGDKHYIRCYNINAYNKPTIASIISALFFAQELDETKLRVFSLN